MTYPRGMLESPETYKGKGFKITHNQVLSGLKILIGVEKGRIGYCPRVNSRNIVFHSSLLKLIEDPEVEDLRSLQLVISQSL